MTTYSPGPWVYHAQGDANEYALLSNDKRWLIAIRQNGEMLIGEQDANVRLLAAAPDLLQALKDLVESIEAEEDFSFEHGMDCDGGEQCAFCSAKNAIALVEEDYISGAVEEAEGR